MEDADNITREFCDGCHVGSLQPCRAIYTQWHNGQFVIVPGVPAWCCDFCGDTFYDSQAMNRLVLLLGPEPGTENSSRRRAAGLEESSGEGLGDRWPVC